jgi:hypothetical protein
MKNACGKIVTAGVAGVKWQLVVVGWKHPKKDGRVATVRCDSDDFQTSCLFIVIDVGEEEK